MYRCQITGKFSKLGEKCNKITIESRPRDYVEWVYNEDLRKSEQLMVGSGFEIVREINASDEGLALWNTMNEDERTHLASLIK